MRGLDVCITCSDEGTLAEVVRADGGHVRRPHRRGHRGDRHQPGRRRRIPATSSWSMPVPRSAIVDGTPSSEPRGDGLPVSVHRGRRARRRRVARRPRCARPKRRRPRAGPAHGRRSTQSAAAIADAAGGDGRTLRGAVGGCSRSAMAAAPPTPPALAALFVHPPRPQPAGSVTRRRRPAVLTALGNDVGFDLVFSRQLIAHARPGDIAHRVLDQRRTRRTCSPPSPRLGAAVCSPIGLAGYDGGAMAASSDIDHCLVVRADSVHRIQETQARRGWSRCGRPCRTHCSIDADRDR